MEKSFFSSTTVAGPGFINVTLSREFLAERVTQILSESDGNACTLKLCFQFLQIFATFLPSNQIFAADGAFSRKKHSHSGLRVVVDYSSPNIAKVTMIHLYFI